MFGPIIVRGAKLSFLPRERVRAPGFLNAGMVMREKFAIARLLMIGTQEGKSSRRLSGALTPWSHPVAIEPFSLFLGPNQRTCMGGMITMRIRPLLRTPHRPANLRSNGDLV